MQTFFDQLLTPEYKMACSVMNRSWQSYEQAEINFSKVSWWERNGLC